MSTREPPADLTIRPPQQRRSREAWARVLDAGVAIIEEGGYEAFTIAAVCERAQVAPRAIYARADTKDALFLAVYEHGISRIRADQAVFDDPDRWTGLPPHRAVGEAIREMARIFTRHARFLGNIVLIAGAHPEVRRRGGVNARALGDQFASLVLTHRDHITHDDPEEAVRTCYNTIFSTLAIRVAYGPGFVAPATDDAAFADQLADVAARFLLGAPQPRP
ncbi:TetR family transcriptional regulator [Actinomadura sp. LD22]|uniref:TetR family transcriptional regulator n=1 Tax=Actinomadura physcomitrii TaxID=2650748 RepID=A0A6I4MIQ7_9ACTN|nr:TetR/AcrR family transcriptional regulator [Actinomadura physcomitrii]MWA03561.1 TetR family transcriptional regulator [Actinomadura physcomitrii]